VAHRVHPGCFTFFPPLMGEAREGDPSPYPFPPRGKENPKLFFVGAGIVVKIPPKAMAFPVPTIARYRLALRIIFVYKLGSPRSPNPGLFP